MASALSIKKQLRVALYTSPLIAALAITPITIINKYPFSTYLYVVFSITMLVLTLWLVNIFTWRLSKGAALKRYLLSIFINILIAWGVSLAINHADHHPPFGGSHKMNFHFHLILFLAINIVILVIQDLVVSREKNAAMQLENQQLKLKNMEAVNQQLKQQIQPHFLFNSLSTLKSLMAANPEGAESYLVRLSEFLRSSLSSHALNTIQLGDELHLCVNYLEMQNIRFGEALQFDIHIPTEMWTTRYLPVFSLQLLAENAIKHNVLTLERPLTITITAFSIDSSGDQFIKVSNNLQKREDLADGTGMGLVNLQERYRILSGSSIVIEETADTFSVSIKALSYEGSDH